MNDFSISHTPPAKNTATLPKIILDMVVPVDNDFTLTKSTTTNFQQIAQTSPPEHFFATHSQPPQHPITMAGPVNTQQPAHAEAAGSKPVEFFPSWESRPNEANHGGSPETCDQARLAEIALFAETVTAQLSLENLGETPAKTTNYPTKKKKNKDLTVKKQKKPEKYMFNFRTEPHYKAYQRAYQDARRAELALSGDQDKAKQVARAAGQAASKAEKKRITEAAATSSDNSLPLPGQPRELPFKAYRRAYIRAQRKACKEAYSYEIALSGNEERAKEAGKAAGQAAGRAAGQAAMKDAGQARSAPTAKTTKSP